MYSLRAHTHEWKGALQSIPNATFKNQHSAVNVNSTNTHLYMHYFVCNLYFVFNLIWNWNWKVAKISSTHKNRERKIHRIYEGVDTSSSSSSLLGSCVCIDIPLCSLAFKRTGIDFISCIQIKWNHYIHAGCLTANGFLSNLSLSQYSFARALWKCPQYSAENQFSLNTTLTYRHNTCWPHFICAYFEVQSKEI